MDLINISWKGLDRIRDLPHYIAIRDYFSDVGIIPLEMCLMKVLCWTMLLLTSEISVPWCDIMRQKTSNIMADQIDWLCTFLFIQDGLTAIRPNPRIVD